MVSVMEWHSADKKRQVCVSLNFTSTENLEYFFMITQTTTDVIMVLELIPPSRI